MRPERISIVVDLDQSNGRAHARSRFIIAGSAAPWSPRLWWGARAMVTYSGKGWANVAQEDGVAAIAGDDEEAVCAALQKVLERFVVVAIPKAAEKLRGLVSAQKRTVILVETDEVQEAYIHVRDGRLEVIRRIEPAQPAPAPVPAPAPARTAEPDSAGEE